MMPTPRRAVLRTPYATHGAPAEDALRAWGLHPAQVLDFSANLNPYGPPPVVQRAARGARLHRYPAPQAEPLRRALARVHGVHPAQVVVGNGSAELIAAVAWAYLRADDTVVVLTPAFGEYARVSRLAGARVVAVRASVAEGFRHDPHRVAAVLQRTRPRLVWLTHPNNPTGQPVDLPGLAAWAEAHPATLFVVDEAYGPVSPGVPSAWHLGRPNVLVLHSWTKDYALAGLRLGYALAASDVAEALRRVLPPWNVSRPALAAGLAVLTPAARRYRDATVRAWLRHKAALVAAWRVWGEHPVPGVTPFFLLPVGQATACWQRLLRYGVVVRDATSFGLPGFVRISPRRPRANARLLAVWARACAAASPPWR